MFPEDAQPNEVQRPVHSRPYAAPHRPPPPHIRTAPKRPANNSYTRSPAKRRRLDAEFRQEIVRELPPQCRKGSPGSHNRRKAFIAQEIENLETTRLGLRVLNYSISNINVRFFCVQPDITKISLAPAKQTGQLDAPPSDHERAPSPPSPPDHIGPLRSFKSGTLSFRIPLAAVPPKAHADADHALPTPLAEDTVTLFGTQTTDAGHALPPFAEDTVSGPLFSTQTCLDLKAISASSRSASPPPSPLIPEDASPAVSRHSPSPSSHHQLAFVLDGEEFSIPTRQQHDKLRRLLCDPCTSSSFIVSMHGFLEGIDVNSRRHWSIPQEATDTSRREFVDDACLMASDERSVTIIGHGRDDQQLSLINNEEMGRNGVVTFTDLRRPWNSLKRGGVSCVAPIKQPWLFASGGHDHNVHLWKLEEDFSSATPQLLDIKHSSLVQSLLGVVDTSRKLVSAGADCSVNLYDLSSQRVVNTLRTSNSVYHLHPTPSPFCSLFELAHREFQFETHDHRLVPSIATQRFGYPNSQKLHGRFMKGASFSEYFSSGDREGVVRVWDFRNVSRPCSEIECMKGQKIAHIVAESCRLVACTETYQISVIHRNDD
ncbi:hypothetical protein C8F01DRAFT_1049977 [Mycena amicta]|nr:hypothetical protein C8F01DRAFT_1049977 [Mycena amicta]